MKKLFALLLAVTMTLALGACSSGNAPSSPAGSPAPDPGAKKVTVGIIQLMEHPSLD